MPAVMIIGGPGGDKEPDDKVEAKAAPLDLAGFTRRRASREILKAIESGDSSALDKALSAHYKACEGEESTDEEKSEDEEPMPKKKGPPKFIGGPQDDDE